jgi:polysaccharide biosynthesis/export protein
MLPFLPSRASSFIAVSLVSVSLSLASCVKNPYIWFDQIPVTSSEARLNLIKPGDRISVFVDQHVDLSGAFDVSSSGDYPQALAGNIVLTGQSTEQAALTIRTQLSRFVQAPTVRVSIILPGPNRITVLGEVQDVGPQSLAYDQGIVGALAAAGGLSQFANSDSIYVVRTKPSALRVRFRYDDLVAPNPRATGFMLQDGDIIVVE